MGDFFGSSKDKPTVTNQTSAPWDKAQPPLEGLMGSATNTFNKYQNPQQWSDPRKATKTIWVPKPGGGSMRKTVTQTVRRPVLAPMHSMQTEGINMTRDLARSGSQGVQNATDFASAMMRD